MTGSSILKTVFLILLTTLLAGTLAALIVAQTASAVASDPAFYKTELEKTGAYDMVYAKLDAAIAEQGGAQATAMLSLSGINVTDIVSRSWIKAQAETLINHGLSYVKGQSTSADLVVDLTEPKANLYAAARAKIQALPPALQAAATSAFDNSKAQLEQKVPDQMDLAAQPGAKQGLDAGRSGYATAQNALLGLMIVALVLAGLVAFLVRQSIPSIARWLGAGLLLGGAFASGLLAVAQGKANEMLSASASTPEGAILMQVAKDGFAAVQSAASPLVTALIIVGAIAIGASFLIKPAQGAQTVGAKDKK